MPTDSLLVSLSVIVMFVVFGAVLFWADLQTRSDQTSASAQDNAKRRAF